MTEVAVGLEVRIPLKMVGEPETLPLWRVRSQERNGWGCIALDGDHKGMWSCFATKTIRKAIDARPLEVTTCRWCDEKIVYMSDYGLMMRGIEPEVIEALSLDATEDGRIWALEDGSTQCTYYGTGHHVEDGEYGPHEPVES